MIRRFNFPDDKSKNRIKCSLKKTLLRQQENIVLLKNCAKKLKIRLKGFRTNVSLELYFDIYKNGCSVCYIYKGWDDPGFRIAGQIELDKRAQDFKERFYEIFKICSGRLINIGFREQSKELLFLTLEVGIYKSGFNVKVFKEAIKELEGALVEIRPFI